jgi:tRNA-uridine aminocarboxypropyltransferase
VALALSALEHDAALREKLLAPFRDLIAKARREGVRDVKRDRQKRR